MKRIHIIGGGTFSHIRSHLALAAPAFGTTARQLKSIIREELSYDPVIRDQVNGYRSMASVLNDYVTLHLTKMADPNSKLVTNQDIADLLERLKGDPKTRVIILNAALCDFDGQIDGVESGPHAQRLKSRDGVRPVLLTPADKLIGSIRRERKDIFVVGFKTTTDETPDDQYAIALNALKRDSLNLVLANDTVTRRNMIVAPEETRYCETGDRDAVLRTLAQIVVSRSRNTFTRSTVVSGPPVAWNDPRVHGNLRGTVDHCITRGAYKVFRNATVGHFAQRVDDRSIITSGRKRNFNHLAQDGMVFVEYEDDTRVIAHGAKPSVGGQSQRIIFREHPDIDCIVHFHCPPKPEMAHLLNHVPQWPNECGSHQCGEATSRGLRTHDHGIKAVMLVGHGPNIGFWRGTPAGAVIDFIDRYFDLNQKTGGLVA